MLFTKPIAGHAPSHVIAAEYPLFDWLRFVLASVVALVHAKVIAWNPASNLAVLVFFALSGFLIGGILLRTQTRELPRFFYNRSTRIWLPYFFAVAVLFALSATRDPINLRWLEFLFYDVTFTHNWFSLEPDVATALAEMPLRGTGTHFWSIAVEEQFYLLAPFLLVVLKYGRSPWIWAAISAGLLAVQQTDFASISLGVLAAILRQFGDWHLHRTTVAMLASLALLSMGAMLTVSYNLGAPIFALCVVLLCARPGHRDPVGSFLGAVSYPMYLNHWMGVFAVNFVANRIFPLPATATGILSYIGGVLAGIACYLLVDRFVMARRNRLYSPALGVGAASIAYFLLCLGLFVGGVRWWL